MKTLSLVVVGLALLASVAGAATDGVYRAHGLVLRYPQGWHATGRALTPVTSPAQVLAVASFPLPRSDRGADGCEPKSALDRLGPRGAFVFGWEYGDLSGTRAAREFPARPRHFRLTHFGPYECLGPSYVIRFREAGRFFQIHVALGPRAGPALRATVLRILDSLTVARR